MLRRSLNTVLLFNGLLAMSSGGFGPSAAARQPQPSTPRRNLPADRYTNARERMVREDIAASGVTDTRVLESMRLTPRHEFVAASQRPLAYFDMSLPIGERQTISGPFVVAYMTNNSTPNLWIEHEIGTGSGYCCNLYQRGTVYSIEIHEALGRARLHNYIALVTKCRDKDYMDLG